MTDGEVAVRQNGHEHAVDAPTVNGQILVDVDDEDQHVEVPAGVDVSYHDEDDVEDELETDGGTTADRTSIEMRGAGIDEELAWFGLIAAVLLFVSGGYLGGTGSSLSGMVAVGGAGLLLLISGPSYWSDRT